MFRAVPIKHGGHRLLDMIQPNPWVQGSTIVAVPYKGNALEIDISDLVGWHFFVMRNFDPEVGEVLRRFADGHHRDVFWDIGANKGACAYQIASALPECKIVAVEPQLDLQRLLESNLHIVAPGRHELFTVGIGEKPGQYEMVIPLANRGRATLMCRDIDEPHDKRVISVITAEALKEQSQYGWPTLVKIDVEGFEESILRSLLPAFRRWFVKCCVFECHRDQAESYSEIRAMMEMLGYRLYAISKTPFSTRLIATGELVRRSTDYAIVREDLVDLS